MNAGKWEPSHADYDPQEIVLARLLGQYADLLAEGKTDAARELLEKNRKLSSKISYELLTMAEMEDLVDPEELPISIGEFTIIRRIGRGGMSVVYEAIQESLQRRVALKVLPPGLLGDSNLVERFHREAMVSASLHHPNIVAIHSRGVDNGQPYFAMELVEGETLHEAERRMQSAPLAGNTPLGAAPLTLREMFDSPPPHAFRWSSSASRRFSSSIPTEIDSESTRSGRTPRIAPPQLDLAYSRRVAEAFIGAANGLQHAHSLGIVHRDIKPSNLIKDERGQVRLLDFGLAWMASQTKITKPVERPGTPTYMSPEQVAGQADLFGPASDIFSLGATLYELLTWSPPFGGATCQEIFHRIAACDPSSVRAINCKVPKDLDTIVMKCLRKDPRERFSSAGELAEELGRFVAGVEIRSRPLPWTLRLARRAWVARGKVATILATAAFIVTAGWLLLKQANEAERAAFDGWKERVAHAGSSVAVSDLLLRSRIQGVGPPNKIALPPTRALSAVEGTIDGGAPGHYEVTADVFAAGPTSFTFDPAMLRDSIDALKRAVKDRDREPIGRYYLARAELIRGNRREAEKLLHEALQRDPSCAPAAILCATLLLEDERPEASAAVAKVEQLAAAPGMAWVRELTAIRRAEQEHRWEDAACAYQQLQAVSPNRRSAPERYLGEEVETLLGFAVALLRSGNLPAALEKLAVCQYSRQDRIEPTLLYARVLLIQHQHKNAAEALEQLYGRHEGAAADELAALIAETYRDAERFDDAAHWAQKIRTESPRGLRLQAEIESRRFRHEAAVAAALRALALDPGGLESLLVLGSAHQAAGDSSEALAQYTSARDLHGDDPRPLVALAVHFELENDLEKAVIHCRQAVEKQHGFADAHYCFARILAKQGFVQEAIREYGAVIEIDSGHALAYNNRGTLLDRTGQLDDALIDYAAAVKLAPQLAMAHYNLGWAYHRQQRMGEAMEQYLLAQEQGLVDPALQGNLAPCLQWKMKLEAAARANVVALRADPTNALLHYDQASVHAWQNADALALLEASEAVKLAPRWPNARTDLGVSLGMVGRYTEALAHHLEATQLDAKFVWGYDNEAMLRLGSSLPALQGKERLEAIHRLEDGEHLPNASLSLRWFLRELRKSEMPNLASYASIDALVDGPETVSGEGEEWRMLCEAAPPSPGLEWTQLAFDDAGWKPRKGPFGFPADRGVATVLDEMEKDQVSLYLRHKVIAEDPSRIQELFLSIRYDDDFVAYLNGKEVARAPPGTRGEQRDLWGGGRFSIDPALLKAGQNVLAIQGINRDEMDFDFAVSPVLEAVVADDETRRLRLESRLAAFESHARSAGEDVSTRRAYFEAKLRERWGEGDYAEALLRSVVASDASRPEPFLALASVLCAKNRGGEAEKLLRAALGTELKRHDSIWEAWVRTALASASLAPAEILASFPPVSSRPSHREPGYNPTLPIELKWLVETLAQEEPIRINCGGSSFRDSRGGRWHHDCFYLAGFASYLPSIDDLARTMREPALQLRERRATELDSRIPCYRVPLPVGDYKVALHFIDGWQLRAGARKFDVLLEGKPVLTDFDPFQGERGKPFMQTFSVRVEDGALEIDFIRKLGEPTIAGIVIERAATGD